MEILKIDKAKYLHPWFLPEINQLLSDIRKHKPNIILGLGTEVSQWLTGSSVEKARGFIAEHRLIPGQKVITAYDPGAVIANYSNRPVLVADIIKAERESHFSDIRFKNRTVLIPETVEDVYDYFSELKTTSEISVDIETFPNQRLIRSVGVSFTATRGMCIPFTEFSMEGGSYWNARDEVRVWKLFKELMQKPNPKIGQNFIYDVDWLYREIGIPIKNYKWDTLLMHHSMYSEMKKSLSFMASLYLDEPMWKGMVSHNPEKE